jgi:hypothetical protein
MEGAIRRDDAGDNDTMAIDNDDGDDHDDPRNDDKNDDDNDDGNNDYDMNVDDYDPQTTFLARQVPHLVSTSIPVSREPSQGSDNQNTVDLNTEITQFEGSTQQRTSIDQSKTYRLIYVPDPTRYGTRESVPSDLAFIKTTITTVEWERIKHLERSVFFLRHVKSTGEVAVYMQEWVRDYHSNTFSQVDESVIAVPRGSPLAHSLQNNREKIVLRRIRQLGRFPRCSDR